MVRRAGAIFIRWRWFSQVLEPRVGCCCCSEWVPVPYSDLVVGEQQLMCPDWRWRDAILMCGVFATDCSNEICCNGRDWECLWIRKNLFALVVNLTEAITISLENICFGSSDYTKIIRTIRSWFCGGVKFSFSCEITWNLRFCWNHHNIKRSSTKFSKTYPQRFFKQFINKNLILT